MFDSVLSFVKSAAEPVALVFLALAQNITPHLPFVLTTLGFLFLSSRMFNFDVYRNVVQFCSNFEVFFRKFISSQEVGKIGSYLSALSVRVKPSPRFLPFPFGGKLSRANQNLAYRTMFVVTIVGVFFGVIQFVLRVMMVIPRYQTTLALLPSSFEYVFSYALIAGLCCWVTLIFISTWGSYRHTTINVSAAIVLLLISLFLTSVILDTFMFLLLVWVSLLLLLACVGFALALGSLALCLVLTFAKLPLEICLGFVYVVAKVLIKLGNERFRQGLGTTLILTGVLAQILGNRLRFLLVYIMLNLFMLLMTLMLYKLGLWQREPEDTKTNERGTM